jgi:hypothetical protein
MTKFNIIYLSIFHQLKAKYKQKANSIALFYISILQISIVFLLGCFFLAFLTQMHVSVLAKSKAITLFIIIAAGIHFSNWLGYSGKQRKEMNAKYLKQKKVNYNLMVLAVIPIICVLFGFLLLQSL